MRLKEYFQKISFTVFAEALGIPNLLLTFGAATTSAVANLGPTFVNLVFTFWPTLPFFTKITSPCTLAMPSPNSVN